MNDINLARRHVHTPEYQYADANHQVRQKGADRSHLDELFEVEQRRQQA